MKEMVKQLIYIYEQNDGKICYSDYDAIFQFFLNKNYIMYNQYTDDKYSDRYIGYVVKVAKYYIDEFPDEVIVR